MVTELYHVMLYTIERTKSTRQEDPVPIAQQDTWSALPNFFLKLRLYYHINRFLVPQNQKNTTATFTYSTQLPFSHSFFLILGYNYYFQVSTKRYCWYICSVRCDINIACCTKSHVLLHELIIYSTSYDTLTSRNTKKIKKVWKCVFLLSSFAWNMSK